MIYIAILVFCFILDRIFDTHVGMLFFLSPILIVLSVVTIGAHTENSTQPKIEYVKDISHFEKTTGRDKNNFVVYFEKEEPQTLYISNFKKGDKNTITKTVMTHPKIHKILFFRGETSSYTITLKD